MLSNIPIVQNILYTCLKYKTTCKDNWVHNSFLEKIKRNLESQHYKVFREYGIAYPGDYKQLCGKIDLYASDDYIDVCLEFDFGLHLRYKSILKMLTSNADICFGIYRGRIGSTYDEYNNKKLFFENKDRIALVKNKYNIGTLGKKFYLINFLNKKISILDI